MKKKSEIFRSAFIPFCFILILWCIKGIEWATGSDFGEWGIKPLTPEGLPGILTSPLIHANLSHLMDNSVPLFLLCWALFYFYKEVAVKVLIFSWIFGGLWVWLGARTGAYHIGASGLIYSFATFLFFSGILRRFPRLMAISMLVVFLYGSLIWGIFPYDWTISWEGHLAGAIAGIVMAYYYRNQGPGSFPTIMNEEEEEEDESNAYWNIPESEEQKENLKD
jgi:membrane associated rhomboid family serine protease